MPTRFESYRMRDGVTPLSEDFFNAVFGDIDTRIAELEQRRADWQEVVDELTAFGLQRIDSLVGPSMAEVNAMIEQLRQRRDELEAAIGHVGDLATKTDLQGARMALIAAIEAEQQARANAVQALAAAKVETVNGQGGVNVTLQPAHLRLGPANGPAGVVITYDGAGRAATLTANVDGQPAAQAITYDAQDRVSAITTTYQGRTRTEAWEYNPDGTLAALSATEQEAP